MVKMKVIINILIIGIFVQSVMTLSSVTIDKKKNVIKRNVDNNTTGSFVREHMEKNVNKADFSEIKENLFESTPHLEQVFFSNNSFITLPENVFKPLYNVTIITIYNNSLTTVPEGLFKGKKKLIKIWIERNHLTTLPKQIFVDQPNLLNLTIRHNNLNNLEDGLFDHNYALQKLDLSYNQLDNISGSIFKNLRRLIRLYLNNNKLFHIETQAFSSLQRVELIDLYNNCLTLEDNHTFDHTYALQELVLSYNQLDNISGSIFKNLKSLIKLRLNNNKLIHIETEAFSSLKSVEWIDLCNNRLTLQDNHTTTNIEIETISPFNSCDSLKTLLLGKNLITAIFPDWTTLRRLEKLDLSFNKITKVENGNIPKNLSFLDLSNNKLTEIDFDVLVKLNATENLYLSENPWKCICENLKSILLMRTFKKDQVSNKIQCEVSEALCSTKIYLAVVITLSAIGFGILVGIILLVYYQQEVKVWLYAHKLFLFCITEAVVDRHKTYDAFISYSHKDEDFVVDELLPKLENGTHPFKLCVHFRDWIGGEIIPEQIARSVNDSRRTIIILSQSFLKSIWGRMEFRCAHQSSLEEGRTRVIVVIYGDIGNIENLDDELKAYLKTNTYLRWGEQYFWNKLRFAMPHEIALNIGNAEAVAIDLVNQ